MGIMLLWIWCMLMVKVLKVELTLFSLFTLCLQCSVLTTCSTLCQTHCSPFGDFWPHLWAYGHGDFFTPCGCLSENQENPNFVSQIWCIGLLSIAIAVCPSRLSFCDFTRFFLWFSAHSERYWVWQLSEHAPNHKNTTKSQTIRVIAKKRSFYKIEPVWIGHTALSSLLSQWRVPPEARAFNLKERNIMCVQILIS